MSDQWSVDLFDLKIADLPVLDSTVGGLQREAVGYARDELFTPLQLGGGVVASPKFIDGVVDALECGGGSVSATVEVGCAHAEFGANVFGSRRVGDVLHYDLIAGEGPEAPFTVVVDHINSAIENPQPGRMAKPILSPRGDRFIWRIGHWIDVLVANLLALQARIGEIASNNIADSAVVHPTAVIERSLIGDGVHVGPYSVIRDSIIRRGCRLQEHSSIAGSFIGPETTVQTSSLVHGSVVGALSVISFHTAIRGSVLFGSSTISAPVVARSVIGSDVFLARDVAIGATNISDEPIRVRVNRRSVDTGIRLLGCVVGNGARIGNGISLPAGFEVPAGAYIADRPISRIAPEAERRTPLMLIDRKFRKLGV